MNISGKRKHHICTVVIRKKGLPVRVIPFFMIILLLLLFINMPRKAEDKLLTPIAKTSVNVNFPKSHEKKATDLFSLPDIYTLMRASSPFFQNLEKKEATLSEKKSEDTSNTYPKSEKVKEKSVISTNLKISNATSYVINPHEFVSKKISYNAVSQSKKVLIIHTHGCETYSSPSGQALGENGSYRTKDMDKNVTSVGKIIANELTKRGISVIYDDTLCDYPSYNASYKTSMEIIERHLKENPDIRFVFDIHRDAIAEPDETPIKLTADIDGETFAQVMIVCGTDSMGLHHPNWRENLTLGLKIQEKLEEKYPGLARPVNLREERFNMHKTRGSLIFEVGTHGNTLEEVQKSGVLLADAISDVICN